jgi:steroid delta-isomerase-like uncharacterized protein
MKKIIFLFILLILFSCKSGKISVENRNKKIVETYFNEVWNKGNVAILDTLLSADYVNNTPSVPNIPKGPEGLKVIVLKTRKIFPDLHYEIQDLTVLKDKVVARLIMTGTQSDTIFGIGPTGKKIEVNQINIEHIKNGKIYSHWRITDQLKMKQQLEKK